MGYNVKYYSHDVALLSFGSMCVIEMKCVQLELCYSDEVCVSSFLSIMIWLLNQHSKQYRVLVIS